MKEIFEQYGSVIIAAVAISALVAIIVMLLATDGVVANSFKNLIDSFFNRAASTSLSTKVCKFFISPCF